MNYESARDDKLLFILTKILVKITFVASKFAVLNIPNGLEAVSNK